MTWWHKLWPTNKLTVPFSETAVRQHRTLFFERWPLANDNTPRPRWSLTSLHTPYPTAAAALQTHRHPAHRPPARSSLSLTEAFIIASTCFAQTQYEVYVAAGHTEWVKPLIGTDAVLVFERLDTAALAAQPLVAGDVILFSWQEQMVLHKLAAIQPTADHFHTHAGLAVPLTAVQSRLAAVFYTRSPVLLDEVPPRLPHQAAVQVDAWHESLLAPLVPANKPTPHSAISLSNGEKRLDWALLRQLLRDYNGDVWRTIANTNSMEPFVDATTALPFERISPEAIAKQPLVVGDIVNWGTPQVGRLHRLIGRGPQAAFYIIGDNNGSVDQLHGREQIQMAEIRHRVIGIIFTRQQILND
ncbi:MAG: hypothetical protein OT477_17725 [Chloroflexi bacterium]|nr:hypothetical protein [Chloroflexota bacterium]